MSLPRTATGIALSYELVLEAPVARVFAALTEPAELARWFCHAADVEPGLDGRIVMRWSHPGAIAFEGRWMAFDRPRACAYEGGNAGYPDGYAGRVEYALDEAPGGGTRLSITHRMPARPDYEPLAERYRGAWPRAIVRLRELLEG